MLLGLQRAELSVTFVSPGKIKALNLKYRGIDAETDVLSFPMYESAREFPAEGPFILGDVVINPSRAFLQSKEHGLSLANEVRWLLVHGILHLLGYDHERSRYAERKMREKERGLLEKLTGGW